MDIDLRPLRRIARLTQLELSQRTGIDRTRLSFAECGYISLSADEQTAIMRAVAEAAETHAASVRTALAATENRHGLKGEHHG